MLETKTRFEQVSLEVVKKITDSQFRREQAEIMTNASREHWIQLCEQASREQDSQRLLQLVQQINELLEKKHGRAPNSSSV